MMTQADDNRQFLDPSTMRALNRAQRSARIKGVIALAGVLVAIAFLLIGFMQMATV